MLWASCLAREARNVLLAGLSDTKRPDLYNECRTCSSVPHYIYLREAMSQLGKLTRPEPSHKLGQTDPNLVSSVV
jgi:hypothetical protein